MASELVKVATTLGAATAINTSYQITKGIDPVPSIVTAGIFFGLLAAVSAPFGDKGYRAAKLFASVILFAVILGRGYPLFQQIQKLIGGLNTPVRKN